MSKDVNKLLAGQLLIVEVNSRSRSGVDRQDGKVLLIERYSPQPGGPIEGPADIDR